MSFPRKLFLEAYTYHQADWTELQDNIGNYYDALIQGHIDSTDPHPNITMDNIPQGTLTKKLSAAEYAKFLTGFYDILDLGSTVTFGVNRSIDSFYFAKDSDADGANIYANDLFSRGYPVYVVVFASPWHQLAKGSALLALPHNLGYRPSFGLLQCCTTDPTGQPEQYICTPGIDTNFTTLGNTNYASWNNVNYCIKNNSDHTYYFQVLLFAYMGA